jgi:hypothetical protein
LIPISHGDFFKKPVQSHAGIVDAEGYALVLLNDLGSKLLHLLGIGDIHKVSSDMRFLVAGSFGDLARGFLQARVVHVGKRERHLLSREAMCECAPNSRGCTSDYGDSAFQVPAQ